MQKKPKKTRIRFSPGEIIVEEFLKPLNLSQGELADNIGLSRPTISFLLSGRSQITVDIATRLAKTFNVSAEMFLNMQHKYNVSMIAKTEEKNKYILKRIKCLNEKF